MFAKSDVFVGGALVLAGILLQTFTYGIAVTSSSGSLDLLIVEEIQRGAIDAEAWSAGKSFPNTSTNSTQRARESLANLVGDMAYNISFEFASEAELYRNQFIAGKDLFSLGRDMQTDKKLITDLLTIHATREKIVSTLYDAYYLTDSLLMEWDRDIFVHMHIDGLIDEHKPYADFAFQRMLTDVDYTFIKDNLYTCEGVAYRVGSKTIEPLRYGFDCERIETSSLNSEREYIMSLYTIVLNSGERTTDELSQNLMQHLYFGRDEDAHREQLAELFVLVLTQMTDVYELGGDSSLCIV